MKHYTFILATLLSLLIPVQSWGGDFQKGFDAYNNGDYATALKEVWHEWSFFDPPPEHVLPTIRRIGEALSTNPRTQRASILIAGMSHAQATEIRTPQNGGSAKLIE